MRIATRRENSAVAILDLEGPLNLAADTESVRDTLADLLQLGVERIVLNMKQVDFLDCAGISRLLEFREQIIAAGGCLKVAELDQRLCSILEVFQLTPVLGVCESESAAIASFFEEFRLLEFSPRKHLSVAGDSRKDSPTTAAQQYAVSQSEGNHVGRTWRQS